MGLNFFRAPLELEHSASTFIAKRAVESLNHNHIMWNLFIRNIDRPEIIDYLGGEPEQGGAS